MTQDEYNERAAITGSGCFIGIIAVLLMLLLGLCSGCKTTETIREVPVITEHTTVKRHTDVVRDTLYQRDSVYHYIQGDTVVIERWHHTVKINKVTVSDTVRDTVPKVVPVTRTEIKEVNRLHWWQHALMWIGGVLLVCGGIILFNRAR